MLGQEFSGQHKRGSYFLYTSGCLNLTQRQFDEVHALIDSPELQPDREAEGATQLCEVSPGCRVSITPVIRG